MGHGPEEIDFDKKGYKLGWLFVYFALFVILLIWIYNQNFADLPV